MAPGQDRGRRRARLIGLAVGAVALTILAAGGLAFDRDGLWQVIRACVADQRLSGLPFPCLGVDLSDGEARGHVVLRPPLSNDLILSPTRRIVGVEDPILQLPDTPNYFAEAWRARTMIETQSGRPPARDQTALIVNSRIVRSQDQLHIHIGCLVPRARRRLSEAALSLPLGAWRLLDPVVPHQPFWALRVRSADLAGVEPFRLVDAELGRAVRDRANLTIMVAGARVDGDDEFLILASYVNAPGSWWPPGAEDLIARHCDGVG
jgi:CDP-diacylglycerol pyrophosphatase